MAKYKLTWKDLSWSDFKIYLFALFKAFIPKKKISNLEELENFIQSKSAWVTQVTLYNYLKTRMGCEVSTMIYDRGIHKDAKVRIISGNVLTGKEIKPDGFLDFYSDVITVIPEGDDYEFFGWNKPIFDKVSTSRALTFSWLMPNKKYDLTTNTNGEHRAFVLTGSYEEVFPLDIYPLQILKACMYKDLDEMEALGMYEVAPEDFALTEFVCVSKQPHQKIIREGLDLMLKEIG